MRARLLALPLVALLAAAVDTYLTRLGRPHLPTEPALYAQAVLLWASLATLALVPATLSARWLPRRRAERAARPEAEWARDALGLLGWTAFPVAAHALLDAYTGIKQDVGGLQRPLPWLGVLALAAATVLVGRLLAPRLARLSPRAVAAAVGALSVVAGTFLPPRGAPAPGPAPAEARPNLLLLVWDTTRAQSLDAYGHERETAPHLTALARRGLLFEEARSVSTFTLSSHVSMLTGVFPSDHTTLMTHMEHDAERLPGVAALLRRAGYRTGAFVGTSVLRAETGLAEEFDVYDDRVDPPVCDTYAWSLVHDVQALLALAHPRFDPNGQPHWFQDFQRPAREVLDAALAWIESDDPRPWFCLVNLYDVHWPYLPGPDGRERLVGAYDGTIDGYLFRSDSYVETEDGVEKGSRLDEEDKRHLRELYEGELWELDREVERFLAALSLESGRTGVIVTSDHGEAFGEANHYEHSAILEPQVRVPLLVVPPGAAASAVHPDGGSSDEPGGVRRADPASGVDVAVTLLSMAGLPVPPGRLGRDLTAPPEEEERGILVEDLDGLDPGDHQVAWYSGTWKLVRTGHGEGVRYELFDLASDPLGVVDVRAEHPDVAEALVAELAEYRARWAGDEKVGGLEGGVIDDDALRNLGYTGEED